MNPYHCNICFSWVYFGDRHPCFDYREYVIHYTRTVVQQNEAEVNTNRNEDTRCTSPASTSLVNSAYSTKNKELNEGLFLPKRGLMDRPIPLAEPFNAPNKRRKMDIRLNQPSDHEKNADAQPGPSTIHPYSIVPDGKADLYVYSNGENPMKSIGQHDIVSGYLNIHLLPKIRKKSYQCEYCEKRFYSKFKKERHSGVHTGEKPFKCNICTKSFSQKGDLVRHMRTHTGEKRFTCGICNKAFCQKQQLDRHMRTHTGDKRFSCDMCHKAFSQRENLKKHMLIHLNEKPFKCKDCGKAFRHKQTLDDHVVVHTGEKPFKCEHCDRTFSIKRHLKHQQKKHANN